MDEDLGWLRRIGDTVIAAFFSAEKPKARESVRQGLRELTEKTVRSVVDLESNTRIEETVRKLYARPKGIRPFHWELEFPEVFRLDESGEPQGGFDVIVGNPPFAGRNTLLAACGEIYFEWLKAMHEESNGNADLAAHFFRRAFRLLREDGCMGLIATNTIAQGDTRFTGLRWICKSNGAIYSAKKRLKWPGEVSVVVSIVHICRGAVSGPFFLDGRKVPSITAFLFHAGGSDDPARLSCNAGKTFEGVKIYGSGFTFDDTDNRGIATSIAQMQLLLQKDEHNAERIFPYIGGEEVNDSPTQAHHRYVINFADFPLERSANGVPWLKLSGQAQRQQMRDGFVAPDYPGPVAADWPDLLSIVRERVKPERLAQKDEVGRRLWWQFLRQRHELNSAKNGLARVLVQSSQAYVHLLPSFQPTDKVLANSLVVFVFDSYAAAAVLTTRVHEIWARFFSGTALSLSRYNASDCFETFPFPSGFESNAYIEHGGEEYYRFRADLMVRNNEGLTKTYNRFHDPNEDSPDIVRLRELHAAMDRTVLNAYGWQDIQPICEFIPEFDDEEDEDDNGRPKKKKYRYKWPELIQAILNGNQ